MVFMLVGSPVDGWLRARTEDRGQRDRRRRAAVVELKYRPEGAVVGDRGQIPLRSGRVASASAPPAERNPVRSAGLAFPGDRVLCWHSTW